MELFDILLAGGVIIFSIVVAFFLLNAFNTPVRALWNYIVIGLCNFMMLATIKLLLTYFNVFVFCSVVVIGMIIFTVITGKVTQTSNKKARNIVAVFILIDFVLFMILNQLF